MERGTGRDSKERDTANICEASVWAHEHGKSESGDDIGRIKKDPFHQDC